MPESSFISQAILALRLLKLNQVEECEDDPQYWQLNLPGVKFLVSKEISKDNIINLINKILKKIDVNKIGYSCAGPYIIDIYRLSIHRLGEFIAVSKDSYNNPLHE